MVVEEGGRRREAVGSKALLPQSMYTVRRVDVAFILVIGTVTSLLTPSPLMCPKIESAVRGEAADWCLRKNILISKISLSPMRRMRA